MSAIWRRAALQLLEPLGGAPCTVVSAHDKERFLGPAAVIESLDAGARGGSAIGFSPALELKPRSCRTIAEKLRGLA